MISVIVPVYNVESVLRYCVDSILAQTYKEFELILVDDGSTDKSGKICDKYKEKDDRIIVIHLENGGVSRARNTGIDIAKGDYFCFVDSDDYIAANYLEELVKEKIDSDCDNIWCGFNTVTKYFGSSTGLHLASEQEEISNCYFSEIMTLYKKWLVQMPWNKLYVAATIKHYSIRFPEDLSLGEDLLFNLEYLDKTNGKIIVINKPLNFYLQNEKESLDNKFFSDMFHIYLRINSELYCYLKKWNCGTEQLTVYYNYCFFSYEKVLRNTFHTKSTIKHKYRYNKKIMKSDEFKIALNKSDCYINKHYRFAYEHYLYEFIRLLDWLKNYK